MNFLSYDGTIKECLAVREVNRENYRNVSDRLWAQFVSIDRIQVQVPFEGALSWISISRNRLVV